MHRPSNSDRNGSSNRAGDSRHSGRVARELLGCRPLPDHRPPVLFEALRDGCITRIACCRARIDHNIHGRQFVLVRAERFTHESLDAIATHRATDDTRGNREAESWEGAVVGACEYSEESIGATASIAIDAIKVGFLPESLCRGERPRASLQVPTTNACERGRSCVCSLRRSAACGPSRGDGQAPDVQRGSPCAREIRGHACDADCSVDTGASC